MRSVLYHFVQKKSGWLITTSVVRGYPRIRAMPIEKRHTPPAQRDTGFLNLTKENRCQLSKGGASRSFSRLQKKSEKKEIILRNDII